MDDSNTLILTQGALSEFNIMTAPMLKQQTPTESWPEQGQWAYEDWLRLPDDGFRYELIEGELLMKSATIGRTSKCCFKPAVGDASPCPQEQSGPCSDSADWGATD